MGAGAALPRIDKRDVFERLAQGRVAGVTVVTPNQRLAMALVRGFDALQASRGLVSWESADVLPFAAFVERLYGDAMYSELANRLPVLLSAAQEQALWEEVIGASEAGKALLSAPSAAMEARAAWQIAHAWKLLPRLRGYPANDDARAFADWAWRYEGITERDHHIDRARLPEIAAPYIAHAAVRTPKTLVAYGFDIFTAQQREFLAALGAAGAELLDCGPDERASSSCRVALTSAKDEIHAAARWARARLEANPKTRIGIVVPDLAKSRNAARRLLAQALAPAYVLPGSEERTLPFNVSLGEPLLSYPIVAAAFLALDIAHGEVEFLQASRLIRSPFIAGAEAELANRARLDAELRRVAGAKIGIARLRRAIAKLTASDNPYRVPPCPILSRYLSDLAKFGGENLTGSRRPVDWGKAIFELLDLAGFPGERPLSSAEYQTLKKLHEAIASFAVLDRVTGRMRFADACARLRRIAADTPFQPEAPEVPIQVLGVLESAGMEFDHLWVMGLTDEAWPIPARPNPFIPVALQRSAGVPESSAVSSLELDRRITQGWLKAAGEVVLSHPLREDDRELAPSPLIRDIPGTKLEDLALPDYDSLRAAIRRARIEECTADSRAPAIAENAPSSGGTSVFADQAACPFRAFALHRLGAKGLEVPAPGPDSRDRGTLIHAMLAKVWTELKSKARLDALSTRDLDALLATAADVAIGRLRWSRPDVLESRFAELEKERLVRLGRAWLEKEKERPAFEIAEIEKKHAVSLGGVTVNAKLDRMDRLTGDEKVSGAHVILDYKTGQVNVGGWFGARPDEPQLPLYSVTRDKNMGGDVAAVAFAHVKAGEMEFKGIARDEGLISGVGTLAGQRSKAAKWYGSWDELLSGWRRELEALGREFASGEARVDPKDKHKLATCLYCEVKPFCRIYERYGAPIAADESGGFGESE
jgi:ATP-dependent helicase/nuclease subunit B